MRRKERQQLLVMWYLIAKMRFLVRDTNAHLAAMERKANEDLERMTKVWQDNAALLMAENEDLRQKLQQMKKRQNIKGKERKRYEQN